MNTCIPEPLVNPWGCLFVVYMPIPLFYGPISFTYSEVKVNPHYSIASFWLIIFPHIPIFTMGFFLKNFSLIYYILIAVSPPSPPLVFPSISALPQIHPLSLPLRNMRPPSNTNQTRHKNYNNARHIPSHQGWIRQPVGGKVSHK